MGISAAVGSGPGRRLYVSRISARWALRRWMLGSEVQDVGEIVMLGGMGEGGIGVWDVGVGVG